MSMFAYFESFQKLGGFYFFPGRQACWDILQWRHQCAQWGIGSKIVWDSKGKHGWSESRAIGKQHHSFAGQFIERFAKKEKKKEITRELCQDEFALVQSERCLICKYKQESRNSHQLSSVKNGKMFHKNCKLKRAESGVKSLTDLLSRIIMVSFSLSSRWAETEQRQKNSQADAKTDRLIEWQIDGMTDQQKAKQFYKETHTLTETDKQTDWQTEKLLSQVNLEYRQSLLPGEVCRANKIIIIK